MIHHNTNDKIEQLTYFNKAVADIQTANIIHIFPEGYYDYLKHIYPNITEQYIQENNKKYNLAELVHTMTKIKIFKQSLIYFSNTPENYSEYWFNKWFITYSIDLTVLLEKHYTSLNEEDVKLIANRINLLKKVK